MRIREVVGISLKSKFFSSNPWSKEGCLIVDCFPCKLAGGEGGFLAREHHLLFDVLYLP